MADHVADTHTVEELAKLSPTQLLVRVLQQSDPVDRINRATAKAYSAAGVPRPPSAHWPRLKRRYEISGRERISDARVHVSFREVGGAGGDMWPAARDASGHWWILMTSHLLHLYSFVGVVDDPIVLAYFDAKSGG
jgi:hypothetical protein